jgi:hypothetical protein
MRLRRLSSLKGRQERRRQQKAGHEARLGASGGLGDHLPSISLMFASVLAGEGRFSDSRV